MECLAREVKGDDEIGFVGLEFSGDEPVEGAGDEDAHGAGAAEGVGHAGEVLPGVGFEGVELDLGIEGAFVEIDEVGNAEELVVIGGGVVAEAVDAGGEEGGFGAVKAVGGENTVLAEERVPEGDVVGDIGDAEEAIGGAEDLDAVAVAHQGVAKFKGVGVEEGFEVQGVELGAVPENETGVGFVEVEEDEVPAVDDGPPPLAGGPQPDNRLHR